MATMPGSRPKAVVSITGRKRHIAVDTLTHCTVQPAAIGQDLAALSAARMAQTL
jgi:hypothetical protein